MTITRAFLSNFTKIKRTPIWLLHLLLPVVAATLYLLYYASAGYHIISDVRLFFVLVQMCYPIFVGIVVPIFINLDRNINNIQNALGIVPSRSSMYLGKLGFLLFLAAINIIMFELCFYVGANWFLGLSLTNFGEYFVIFCICLCSSLFLIFLHVPIAFKFGPSISVLAGIFGTIFAGYFENAIGNQIWPFIPWEWGVRFLENYFGYSKSTVFPGILSLIIVTSMVLVLSMLWFRRWEGKVTHE
jgi:lantibiotic transport system permease protein